MEHKIAKSPQGDPPPIGSIPIFSDGPLDDPGLYCCGFIEFQLKGTCRDPNSHTTNTTQCPDQVICYSAKLHEYSISPLGLPNYTINYCPSCGQKFPTSLRRK